MRKVIASINMTLDGFCDHTAVEPDDGLMEHFNDVLKNAGAMLYGRTTYQLMESYWPTLVKTPSGNPLDDEFAVLMETLPKVLFSRTLHEVTWTQARLAKGSLEAEIRELRQQPGKPVYIGSPGLIAEATKLRLVDEFQLVVHPVIAGNGLPLFRDLSEQVPLKLIKSKILGSGAVVLYYELQRTL